MSLDNPPSTPTPAPPLNVPGLTCTGTMFDTEVNYTCQRTPANCGALSSYETEHLLKPYFWVLALLILYYFSATNRDDPHQLLAKLRLGRPQPRSRATQFVALLVHMAILSLAWFEEYMVMSTWWRAAPRVLSVWRPSLTPVRLSLVVLYPLWAVVTGLCMAVVSLALTAGTRITQVQMGCVKEMALLVMGRKELDSRVLVGEDQDGGDGEHNGENKVSGIEATKVSKNADEKTQD
ncbi:hypothetical protein F4859DRAFT_52495 [Xylaria cf. heliscus]|nr:hypothetical protein F4859DRAFT_52495 [Xylaria cf. heliscus]